MEKTILDKIIELSKEIKELDMRLTHMFYNDLISNKNHTRLSSKIFDLDMDTKRLLFKVEESI
ncbi:hypothetical protein [Nitrosopumilus sp.]|uniref:hypothetical protein n=1 Tax=Nitrosopumilus sp. TaxID=2024843 RepID=UPI003D0C74E6